MPPPDHRVRLRDGDREVEVSGNPAFVRQVLDDLPSLLARLRGESPGRSTISMPAPPSPAQAPLAPERLPVPAVDLATPTNGSASHMASTPAETATSGSLEDRIIAVLRDSSRPLAVAAIRERLEDDAVSGQQVRRLLERATSRVRVSTERPATYSLH